MTSSAFQCRAVSPALPRRAFLAGAAGLVGAAPFGAAASAAPGIADLAGGDGRASALARRLAGEVVTLRGYFAPSVTDGEFLLYEAPAAPCQLCGGLHDAGASLVAAGAEIPAGVSMLRLIEARGRLAIADGMPRLEGAGLSLV